MHALYAETREMIGVASIYNRQLVQNSQPTHFPFALLLL